MLINRVMVRFVDTTVEPKLFTYEQLVESSYAVEMDENWIEIKQQDEVRLYPREQIREIHAYVVK